MKEEKKTERGKKWRKYREIYELTFQIQMHEKDVNSPIKF